MSTDEKIYTPEVIEDTPFPGQEEESLASSQSGVSTGALSPSTIKNQPLPRKMIAHELLNERLNTKTGNILGQFNFQPSGALQIGKYVDGESGDIRISPNGIVARDKYGINTIAIDGDTGDVVIRGSLQSGSVITGDIAIEEGGQISIGGDPILDEFGIVSTTNFQNSNNIISGINQSIGAGSFTDVTNSSYVIALPRAATVVFLYAPAVYLVESAGNTGNGEIDLNIDGVDLSQIIFRSGNINAITLSSYHIVSLTAGNHTIKLRAFLSALAGAPTMTVVDFRSSYFVLGT